MARKKQEPQIQQSAVIYARYSSHSQREESIEQQIDECLSFASANNLKVVDTYVDKAVSGKTERRSSFQRLMRDAEKGKFQVVIAYKSNRIARNMLNALQYESKLDVYGIRTLYAKEEFGNTAAGRFALRTMMNVNQFYSENMAEDIMRGMMDNAEHCKVNGTVPYGYHKGPDGCYEIDELESAVVREIYEKVLAGETFAAVAESLNARGIKTRRHNAWGKSSFYKICTNDTYTGIYRYADVEIPGGVPMIIPKEEFEAMQDHMRNKKNATGSHRQNSEYLLTGKLYCGHCGTNMVGICGTSGTGAMHYYYVCNQKRMKHSCSKENVRRDWLEQRIAEITQETILQDDVIEWIADNAVAYQKEALSSPDMKLMEETLAENKTAQKNIMKAIEAGIFTASTKDRLLELESDISRLEMELARMKAVCKPIERERIIYAYEKLKRGNPKDRKYQKILLDTFVKKVYLWDDHIRIDYYYTGKGGSVTVPLDISDVPGTDSTKFVNGSLRSTKQKGLYKKSQ